MKTPIEKARHQAEHVPAAHYAPSVQGAIIHPFSQIAHSSPQVSQMMINHAIANGQRLQHAPVLQPVHQLVQVIQGGLTRAVPNRHPALSPGCQQPHPVIQCLPKLRNESEAIEYFEDHLADDPQKNADEIALLKAMALAKHWDDLQERIEYYLAEHARKHTASGHLPVLKDKSSAQAYLAQHDTSEQESLPQLLHVLNTAKENQWDDVEEEVLPSVRRLEDVRDFGDELEPAPALTIEEVMAAKSLSQFIMLQNLFQSELTHMDGLQSAGYEFEFASFTRPGEAYTNVEIIPSHRLMASATMWGNYFKLKWRLESDSFNTLELVTPPFVFPKDSEGSQMILAIEKEIGKTAEGIAESQGNSGTMTATTAALTQAGLGSGWNIASPFAQFGVVKNKKSGGHVYGQKNVSMLPEEIGAELASRMSPYLKIAANVLEPEGMSIAIYQKLLSKLEQPATTAVDQAMAVFGRYCSNALAIPSMRWRQATGVRKDTTPTQVKESFGIWVKTDALNILKPILAQTADRLAFRAALDDAGPAIEAMFRKYGEFMIAGVTPPPTSSAATSSSGQVTMVQATKHVMATFPNLIGKPEFMDKVKEYMAQQNTPSSASTASSSAPVVHPDVQRMQGFALNMLQEVHAFIGRALDVGDHQETDPTATTEQFLDEQYGSGGGVRKGTYLKGVPTSKGKMYVTEIRPQH